MNLIITNEANFPVPIVGSRPDFADMLLPEQATTISQTNSVMIMGEKPGVRAQFEEAGRILLESAKALLKAFEDRTAPDMPTSGAIPLSASVTNTGSNAVRVILGDGVTDVQIPPGQSAALNTMGYFEFRELGLAPQQGGTPD